MVEAAVAAVCTGSPWIEDIRRVSESLESLNGATERDFLAVGGNLMTFLSAARQLRDQIAELTSLASGEQAQNACQSLVSVRGYVEEMQSRAEQDGHALLALKSGGERIRQGFSTFGQVVLAFRTTAIAAKIEVAHISTSEENLGSLANDVHSCIEGMGAASVQIMGVAMGFDSLIASTLREVSRLSATQLEQLPSLLAAVDADVAVFQSAQRAAVKTSAKLAADLEAMTRDLGVIATSIQFHDITRQQIEHIIETLRALMRDAPQGAISAQGGALVRLQKAQLQSAARAFVSCTEKIQIELGGIARQVGAMAAGSCCIPGVESKNDSVGHAMQRRFAAIARAVTELHSMERGVRGIVTELQSAGRDLGVAVSEVQSIESQLNRISINAVISAMHLGPQGAVLKAIATAIGELGRESAARSGGAKRALSSIEAAIVSMAGANAHMENHDGAESLVIELEKRVSELQRAGASGDRAAAKVGDLAASLGSTLKNARDGFGIGAIFAEAVNGCCDLLDGVAAQTPWTEVSDEEEFVVNGYTMESQRDVHRAMSNGSENGAEAESLAPADSCDDVEFF